MHACFALNISAIADHLVQSILCILLLESTEMARFELMTGNWRVFPVRRHLNAPGSGIHERPQAAAQTIG